MVDDSDLTVQQVKVCITGTSLLWGHVGPAGEGRLVLEMPEYLDGFGQPILHGQCVKESMLHVARCMDWSTKAVAGLRASFFIPWGLPIAGEKHRFVQELERVPFFEGKKLKSGPWTRWVPEYRNWSCTFTFDHLPAYASLTTLAALLVDAGERVGVGIQRPWRGGDHGTFRVAVFERAGVTQPKRRVVSFDEKSMA